MVNRKIEHAEGVFGGIGQDAQLQIGGACVQVVLSKVSFPLTCLMAISETEIALISRTAAALRNAAIALREMRSGDEVAQMNVTVSRRIRI